MILGEDFWARPATELAPILLGKWLCVKLDGVLHRHRITETECYFGEEDTACHAHKGKTPRTEVLYRAGGITYVYLCYGIHSLLNLVTGPEGHPEAVLIRGIEGASGPGRVTKLLALSCRQNALPLTPECGIWVEDDGSPTPSFEALPRVGIGYASPEDIRRPWRFLIK
ncbi:MAG: DNA-3-methyladenine glycosylase [Ruminococcaceae bacterium]|nr:DNA-3-methyladenine glycosylase [Oscillospiraceae bacterium]